VKRFAMDVTIGFLFGASWYGGLHLSYWSAFFLGTAFLVGSRWGEQVFKEAKEWEQQQCRPGGPVNNSFDSYGPKVGNWNLYYRRIEFINVSHRAHGWLLVLFSIVFGALDPDKKYFFLFVLVIFLLNYQVEKMGYRYETAWLTEAANVGVDSNLVVLDSICYIPKWILRRWEKNGKKQ
jgi:hypothetical protein